MVILQEVIIKSYETPKGILQSRNQIFITYFLCSCSIDCFFTRLYIFQIIINLYPEFLKN